jgi:hypothetical protein
MIGVEIQALISRVSFLLQKSLGVWFVTWAVRYKADWDYKLSGTAKAVRWAVAGIGYLLAGSLPGPPPMRVVPGLLGICFLCRPNFAYHSASQDGPRSTITYSFELGRLTNCEEVRSRGR